MMRKLNLRELTQILIDIDGFGRQKLSIKKNGRVYYIDIRYGLPGRGDMDMGCVTRWKKIGCRYVPRMIECYIYDDVAKDFPELQKYKQPGYGCYCIPERLFNHIFHCYEFQFGIATLDRMRFRGMYPEFWSKVEEV